MLLDTSSNHLPCNVDRFEIKISKDRRVKYKKIVLLALALLPL